MIAVRRGKILLSQPAQQESLLTVTLNSTDPVTATIPAMKYNKQKVVIIDWDDALIGGWDALKTAGITFTDGAGNNRLYAGALAMNGGYSVAPSTLLQMIADGWDLANHSTSHNPYVDESSVLSVHNEVLADTGYRFGAGVVPTNYAGYHAAFEALGYIASDTQNSGQSGNWDGYTEWPTEYTDGNINTVPDQRFYVVKRDFVNDWLTDDLSVYTNKITGSVNLLIIGCHEFNQGSNRRTAFMNWVNNIKSSLGDTLIFCSLREYLEYVFVRNRAVVSQDQNGSTLDINVDYSTIPDTFSWYDLSFTLPPGSIQSVSCSDNSFTLSHNPTTGLINLSKRKIVWS